MNIGTPPEEQSDDQRTDQQCAAGRRRFVTPGRLPQWSSRAAALRRLRLGGGADLPQADGVDPRMPIDLLDHALAAPGFMPKEEGFLLFEEAARRLRHGPALEVGTWCGKSAVYLGAAARVDAQVAPQPSPVGSAPSAPVVFTLDHHRGSEENQPGWEYHDPNLVDPDVGRIDTLPFFRRTINQAGLEDVVIAIVGASPTVSAHWRTPLSLLFIDGGHTDQHVTGDYLGFGRWVDNGASLVFHDVFEHPEDGGQAPWRCYRRALGTGVWEETHHQGSMRFLRRVVGKAGEAVG